MPAAAFVAGGGGEHPTKALLTSSSDAIFAAIEALPAAIPIDNADNIDAALLLLDRSNAPVRDRHHLSS